MNGGKRKLAVLVSGGGTNLQAVINACKSGKINAEVAVVISSNSEAFALTRAKDNAIPAFVCSLKDYETRQMRDEKIKEILKKHCADYVILAGYLGVLSPCVISEFPYKIINIHPALLPNYGGKSFYGIKVHEAVIAAGERYSGATAHFVDENIDTGLIIRQKRVKIDACDTPQTLQKKILQTVEHELLVDVIKDLCSGAITVQNNKIVSFSKD